MACRLFENTCFILWFSKIVTWKQWSKKHLKGQQSMMWAIVMWFQSICLLVSVLVRFMWKFKVDPTNPYHWVFLGNHIIKFKPTCLYIDSSWWKWLTLIYINTVWDYRQLNLLWNHQTCIFPRTEMYWVARLIWVLFSWLVGIVVWEEDVFKCRKRFHSQTLVYWRYVTSYGIHNTKIKILSKIEVGNIHHKNVLRLMLASRKRYV